MTTTKQDPRERRRIRAGGPATVRTASYASAAINELPREGENIMGALHRVDGSYLAASHAVAVTAGLQADQRKAVQPEATELLNWPLPIDVARPDAEEDDHPGASAWEEARLLGIATGLVAAVAGLAMLLVWAVAP